MIPASISEKLFFSLLLKIKWKKFFVSTIFQVESASLICVSVNPVIVVYNSIITYYIILSWTRPPPLPPFYFTPYARVYWQQSTVFLRITLFIGFVLNNISFKILSCGPHSKF